MLTFIHRRPWLVPGPECGATFFHRRRAHQGFRSSTSESLEDAKGGIHVEFALTLKLTNHSTQLLKKTEFQGTAAGGANEAASALDDLFPRADMAALVTDDIIAELGDANWKIRKEALDKVGGILQSANNRIKPTLGDLPTALKERLNDSNKNLVIQTLDLFGGLAAATGKQFDRTARFIAPSICSCLTDNKPHVRASATAALEKICAATSFEVVEPACETGLAVDNPSLRKDLLTWISFKLHDLRGRSEAIPSLPGLVTPTLLCTQDKNLEVRKAAQTVLPHLVDMVGYDVVHDRAMDIKGPAGQSIATLVETFKPARSSVSAPSLNRGDTGGKGTPKKSLTGPLAGKSAVLAAGAKRKAAPAGSAAPAEAASATDNIPPLLSSDPSAKKDRADKDKGSMRWQFEAPRKDLTDLLEEQTDGNFSSDIRALMFRDDHTKDRDHLKAVSTIEECITNCASSMDEFGIEPADMAASIVANTDLILKYITIRLCDTNTIMLLKVISLLDQLFILLGEQDGFRLTEYEAQAFLPFLVTKVSSSVKLSYYFVFQG